MKHTNKHIYILAFSFVLLAQNVFAQTDYLATVKARIESFNNKLVPEKMYVHSDKSFYTAGEIVWFKMYAFEAFNNKPVNISKVAYAEILDAGNKAVVRTRIAMDENGGHGSFQLPVSLPSGYYTLRAYTNAMKNLGAEYFYSKQLTIVNPLKSLEAVESAPALPFELALFPEGGNLVQGIQSRVAYRITNQEGNSVEGKGYLLNQNNDTLSVFSPFKFGMGSFDLTPRPGFSYKVIFVLPDGRFIASPLPEVFDKGYVMTVEDAENDRISVTVHTNIKSGYPEIFLMAQTRQQVKAVKRAVISDGMTSFLVDRSDLGEGVSQLTIFNNEKQPVCERLYFIQPAHKTTSINSTKNEYGVRENVSLTVGIPGVEKSNVSLAVFQTDSLQKPDEENILSYIWLSSELKGNIEQPGYYFNEGREVKKTADLLMLTHGWRRFNWETILNSDPVFKIPYENTGHLITAKLVDKTTNRPARNVQAFLSIPGSKYKLYTALSGNDGMVSFDVKDYYGPGEVILQTNTQRDSTYRIELQSPYAETFTSEKIPAFKINASSQSQLESYSIGMQAQHIYSSDSIKKFFLPAETDTFSFYGKPMNAYRLDDYKRFATMEEVLREYVREVNVGVKASGSSLRFKLFNELNREYYTDNILVLVDGVPLFNPNLIFNFDPVKIKALEVITKNYVLGSSVFHGLASFKSYSENFEGFDLTPEAVAVDYEGLQLHREFYSPDYSDAQQRNSRIPDLRNTLYWQPVVNSSAVNFYTGDNKGSYLVVVQGVDAQGKPVAALSGFRVK